MKEDSVLLSVIVPLYNARNTIHRCLDSILQEKKISLEVICVNDESTDNTLQICQEYQDRDDRIKIVDRKNGGVASARNSGLKVAVGDYVTVIDQDDWIEENAYSIMLQAGLRENADMIVCGYSKDYGDDVRRMTNRRNIPDNISSVDELIKYAFFRGEYKNFAAFVWNKVFKREVLSKGGIDFDGTLKRGDDVLFYTKVAATTPKTIYPDEHFYHYVQSEDSITHTLTKENLQRLSEILIGYEKAIAVLEDCNIKAGAVNYMKCFYVYHASNLYELAERVNALEEKERFIAAMQKYIDVYKEQNSFSKERIERIEAFLAK